MLLISVRKKHFLFWLTVMIMLAGLWVGYSQIFADTIPPPEMGVKSIFSKQLLITSKGKALLQNQDISRALQPGGRRQQTDSFFYKFLDSPGVSFKKLEITVTLPEDLDADLVKVKPILSYTQLPRANVKKKGNQIIITGFQLGPQTLFSLNMLIPKGKIIFPWYKKLFQFVKSESILIWGGVSILFPLAAVISFLIITQSQRQLKKKLKISSQIDHPPSLLDPAIVGILYHNKITPKAIAAFLLNMANKGWLEIILKDDQFSFSRLELKSKQAEGRIELTSAEKVILSKLFKGKKFKAEESEVRLRMAHRIFSGKMALFYYLLYHQAFEKRFFVDEPSIVHRHFRNWGLAIFFGGIAGLVINLLIAPVSMVILWLGMVLAGVLFVWLSSRVSFLSPSGLRELQKWLAFRNFLVSSRPLGAQASEKKILFDYLPYALVLDCEQQWLDRFEDKVFTPPEWYVTFSATATQKNFKDNLLSLFKWLSESLSYAKDPSVE